MAISLQKITPADAVVSQWSGGSTAQLGIAPAGAVYADREFLWRLSSATVELPSSDFTALPDYQRLISVLQGGMTLSHPGSEPITLSPYEVYAFDGGIDTHSEGSCTDFNLMLRKGACEGSLSSLALAAGSKLSFTCTVPAPQRYDRTTLVLYCGEGEAVVTAEGAATPLAAGELLQIEGDQRSLWVQLAAKIDTRWMVAQIFHP